MELTKMDDFPRTRKACLAAEASSWAIGEALLKETDGGNAGKHGFSACVAELKEYGINYSTEYLSLMRRMAQTYPAKRRHPEISFRNHVDAGNPDTLDVIVRAAKKARCTISGAFIRDVLRRQRADEREEQKRQNELAKAKLKEAREAEARARERIKENDPDAAGELKLAKEKRKRHVEQVKATTSRNVRAKAKPPAEADVIPLQATSSFMALSAQARRLAEQAIKPVRKQFDKLSEAQANRMIYEANAVHLAWRGVKEEIEKARDKRGAHLSTAAE
jgi:hypothetical protein